MFLVFPFLCKWLVIFIGAAAAGGILDFGIGIEVVIVFFKVFV